PAGRVGVEPLECGSDLGDQRRIEEIIGRPADFDRRDDAVEGDADFLEACVVGHFVLSFFEPRRHGGHEEFYLYRYPGEGRDPLIILLPEDRWVPAFAGMTVQKLRELRASVVKFSV